MMAHTVSTIEGEGGMGKMGEGEKKQINWLRQVQQSSNYHICFQASASQHNCSWEEEDDGSHYIYNRGGRGAGKMGEGERE